MKRIGLTQRRDQVPGRSEIRDALDVLWARFLFDLGFLPVPVCSELANCEGYIEALDIQGVLLSGGNDIGEALKRDKLEHRLLDYAKQNELPVLGVCRGMQMINHYFDGCLVQVTGHVATRHQIQGTWVNENGYSEVNSYHNQAIVKHTLAKCLQCLAATDDGVIEAIKHESLNWWGIMWHPEREGIFIDADKHLVKNIFGGRSSLDGCT